MGWADLFGIDPTFMDEENAAVLNELMDLIYDNMPWEGETYQAVAERIAVAIVAAGWQK